MHLEAGFSQPDYEALLVLDGNIYAFKTHKQHTQQTLPRDDMGEQKCWKGVHDKLKIKHAKSEWSLPGTCRQQSLPNLSSWKGPFLALPKIGFKDLTARCKNETGFCVNTANESSESLLSWLNISECKHECSAYFTGLSSYQMKTNEKGTEMCHPTNLGLFQTL